MNNKEKEIVELKNKIDFLIQQNNDLNQIIIKLKKEKKRLTEFPAEIYLYRRLKDDTINPEWDTEKIDIGIDNQPKYIREDKVNELILKFIKALE